MPTVRSLVRAAVASAVLCTGLADAGYAQRVDRIPAALLHEVMPGADRFAGAAGDPPVISAYRTAAGGEALLGYVFLTSDLPPEQFGYSGPIEALVGMDPEGQLTGMRVTDYNESYMRSMGDFLRTPGFQEQFAGKYIGDPFQVWGDVEGISRVSISVRALSRGVRDAARRVANAYGESDGFGAETSVVDVVGRSWFELRQLGVVRRFEVTEPGEGSAGIALAHIPNERVGEFFFGPALYERALRSAERRSDAGHMMVYTVDGSRLRLFRQQGWAVVQGSDTIPIEPRNVVGLGLPSGGVVSGEATMVGLMLVSDTVDMSRPVTFVYDLGDLGVHSVEYLTQEARLLAAEEAAAEEAAALQAAAQAAAAQQAAEAAAAEVAEAALDATPRDQAAADLEREAGESRVAGEEDPRGAEFPDGSADPMAAGEGGADSAATGSVVDAGGDRDAEGDRAGGGAEPGDGAVENQAVTPGFDFVLTEDESLLERTLAGTSWSRVATMLAVLALALWAFLAKNTVLRWVSLSVTLVVLGFVDGGFLSVSHITSGIWAGVGVYVRDLPLLLMVVFTLVTTLVWGRVFCGYLCPFGALQDIIDRVVPARFQRALPQLWHDRAVYAKYVVLAIIVVAALGASEVSLYQYFEPFGTVFFMSSSLPLWLIAGGFLLASAVVPRFYCRYACPLGAALGVVSLISLRRIARVEQCDHCKVCEQRCPTGAIRGPAIDFHECVRCNVCEIQLIERAGVCRHEMDAIRPRLIQLEVGEKVAVSDA